MNLSEYILEDRIIFRLNSVTNKELITEFLMKLQEISLISEKIKLESMLLNTECIVDKGVAFLHCQSIEIKLLTIVLGISKEGINFNSPNRQTANLILLTISPAIEPNKHRKFLSRFKLMISSNNMRNNILKAFNKQKLTNIINEWEKKEQSITNI